MRPGRRRPYFRHLWDPFHPCMPPPASLGPAQPCVCVYVWDAQPTSPHPFSSTPLLPTEMVCKCGYQPVPPPRFHLPPPPAIPDSSVPTCTHTPRASPVKSSRRTACCSYRTRRVSPPRWKGSVSSCDTQQGRRAESPRQGPNAAPICTETPSDAGRFSSTHVPELRART